MKRVLLVLPIALFIIFISAIAAFSRNAVHVVTPAVTYVFRQLPIQQAEPVQILFTGDIMLDRNVALHALSHGDASLFAGVQDLFKTEDAIVPNLEGTITANPSISIASSSILRFTFDPHYASFLKSLGITAVSLSNNHTDDFGEEGYLETKNALQKVGILSFGSPSNDDELSGITNIKGTRVCFVGYEEFIQPDTAPFVAEIKRIRSSCDYLVATMHGGVEYQAVETTHQEEVAHAFIDAGADAVMGTHPHVVEPLEIYKGKPIFYSLGNFMFDQNFSFATTHGLAVQVAQSKDQTHYTLIPVTIQNEEVSISTEEDAARTLTALTSGNVTPDMRSGILKTHGFSF